MEDTIEGAGDEDSAWFFLYVQWGNEKGGEKVVR